MALFDGPRLKRDRSLQLLDELEDRLASVRCIIEFKGERMGGYEFEYKLSEEPSPTIPLGINEATHHLRSSLDNLVSEWATYRRPDLSQQQKDNTYFPITDSLKSLEKQIEAMSSFIKKPAANLIKSYKPYKGGNDVIYALHDFSKSDKHQTYIYHYLGAMQIDNPIWQEMNQIMGMPPQYVIPGETFIIPKHAIGSPLSVPLGHGAVQPVFGDGLYAQGVPAGPFLRSVAQVVSEIIERFATELVQARQA